MGFIEALVLILIVLKLLGVIAFTWLQCFSPFLLYPALITVGLVIFFGWAFLSRDR